MDTPRTYLADVAKVILFKLGRNEDPDAVEQAIVDLQGVIRLKENNALNRVDLSPFEEAAVEALEELPLAEWLVAWRQKMAEEQAAAAIPAEIPADAELQQGPQVPGENGQQGESEQPPAGPVEMSSAAEPAQSPVSSEVPEAVKASGKPSTKAKAKQE